MSRSLSDLVLHPVRLRIMQALLGGKALTTQQLGEQLPDVTSATLYRQVATLLEAGMIAVESERRVRGAVERTYVLAAAPLQVPEEELHTMSIEDHRRGFAAFIAGLLAGFDSYLATRAPDLVRDRVGYRQVAVWATDEELDAAIAEMRKPVAALAENAQAPGRRLRMITNVLMPAELGE